MFELSARNMRATLPQASWAIGVKTLPPSVTNGTKPPISRHPHGSGAPERAGIGSSDRSFLQILCRELDRRSATHCPPGTGPLDMAARGLRPVPRAAEERTVSALPRHQNPTATGWTDSRSICTRGIETSGLARLHQDVADSCNWDICGACPLQVGVVTAPKRSPGRRTQHGALPAQRSTLPAAAQVPRFCCLVSAARPRIPMGTGSRSRDRTHAGIW